MSFRTDETANNNESYKIDKDQGCRLCPRSCGARRMAGEKGVCLADGEIRIARAALHMWEEPCISGRTGSGAVFFSGCPLHCVYCQNREIASGKGWVISQDRLSEIFLELQAKKAVNINLVTPTHYTPQIVSAICRAREMGLSVPVVYNCSGYESVDTLRMLDGSIDIYLTDFKYPDSEGARRYSNAPDYPEKAMEALGEMVRQCPAPEFSGNRNVKDEDELLMTRGVIVRHLLLPGRVKQACETVRRVYEKFGSHVFFSLMNQFTPVSSLQEKYPEIARRVTEREYERWLNYVIDAGVEQAFIQEGGTAEESFIPSFEGEGVLKYV